MSMTKEPAAQQKVMTSLSEELREIVINRKESEKLHPSDCASAVIAVLLDIMARAHVTENWENGLIFERYDTVVRAGRLQLAEAIVTCQIELAHENEPRE